MNAPLTERTATGDLEVTAADAKPWQKTACILCESNCGIEVRLGEDGHSFERIRGDKAHPGSHGYTCEKALRLDRYQNGTQRLTSPLRRTPEGTYEEISWDTAISEITSKFSAITNEFGGNAVAYYGGGGQGNHLGGGYSGATLRAIGTRYRASALSQEKTGEFWVNGKMLGGLVRGDFEHAEVSVFVGKNPWQSHGMPHARTVLKEIANDPTRKMIVIDPRLSETAEMADIHLRLKPGTDAWCLSAIGAVIVQEKLQASTWLSEHANGVEAVEAALSTIDVEKYAAICDVDAGLIREAARMIAKASSCSVAEDLGIQMGNHSTLCSYLEKLVWMLTGHFGRPGTSYIPSSLVPITSGGSGGSGKGSGAPKLVTPVIGARIIGGLMPCNSIAEEILTDHPARFRAMLIESGNPAHSIADSNRMREALLALDLVVVIDIAMTETARLASYVLPAASQFEKWESTFFNFEFPNNVFHLRRPFIDPLPGTLAEPEIHARLVEAFGKLDQADVAPLLAAAELGRAAFADAFFTAVAAKPQLGGVAPVLLYRALGPSLDRQYGAGAASAALLWGAAHKCALQFPQSVARAGFVGEGLEPGEALFEAIMTSPSGVTFTIDEYDDSWRRVKTDDGKLNLEIPELLDMLSELDTPPLTDPAFPMMLSAGERRSFTANTIIRDNSWRKKDPKGALRISPEDADRIGLLHGGMAKVSTPNGQVNVTVEITHMMRSGHISLPNGMGVGNSDDVAGVAPNELTDSFHRDPIALTPFHKQVAARVEAI